MAGIKDSILFGLVHDFFKEYLPKQVKKSPNTIYAYRESLNALFEYVKSECQISLSEITFDMIDRSMLIKFLDYLEIERGCSIETRNHRLNRIRAF